MKYWKMNQTSQMLIILFFVLLSVHLLMRFRTLQEGAVKWCFPDNQDARFCVNWDINVTDEYKGNITLGEKIKFYAKDTFEVHPLIIKKEGEDLPIVELGKGPSGSPILDMTQAYFTQLLSFQQGKSISANQKKKRIRSMVYIFEPTTPGTYVFVSAAGWGRMGGVINVVAAPASASAASASAAPASASAAPPAPDGVVTPAVVAATKYANKCKEIKNRKKRKRCEKKERKKERRSRKKNKN